MSRTISYLAKGKLGSIGLEAGGHSHMVETKEAAARKRQIHSLPHGEPRASERLSGLSLRLVCN